VSGLHSCQPRSRRPPFVGFQLGNREQARFGLAELAMSFSDSNEWLRETPCSTGRCKSELHPPEHSSADSVLPSTISVSGPPASAGNSPSIAVPGRAELPAAKCHGDSFAVSARPQTARAFLLQHHVVGKEPATGHRPGNERRANQDGRANTRENLPCEQCNASGRARQSGKRM